MKQYFQLSENDITCLEELLTENNDLENETLEPMSYDSCGSTCTGTCQGQSMGSCDGTCAGSCSGGES